MTTIKDRTGRKVSQKVVDKAASYVDHVTTTAIPTLWHVNGLGGTYRVIIDAAQHICSCPGGTENGDRLCSHVLAVWLYQQGIGEPVRIAQVDGPSPVLANDDDTDPFAGL